MPGVRHQTRVAAQNSEPLIRSALENGYIDPDLILLAESLLDVYTKSDAATEDLRKGILEMINAAPISSFLAEFNARQFRPLLASEVKRTTPHASAFSKEYILVKFKSGTSQARRSQILGSANASIERHFKAISVYKILIPAGAPVADTINLLEAFPEVEYAEPDYTIKINLSPNDLDPRLWGLHNFGQDGGVIDADIDAPEAWGATVGGVTVVAVIDTGVDYDHEDLASNMWVNLNEVPNNSLDDDSNGYIDDYRGWDFVNDDNDPLDDHNHGTHVSGTIGAVGNNGKGVVGVNWTVRIMPLKFLDQCGSGST